MVSKREPAPVVGLLLVCCGSEYSDLFCVKVEPLQSASQVHEKVVVGQMWHVESLVLQDVKHGLQDVLFGELRGLGQSFFA